MFVFVENSAKLTNVQFFCQLGHSNAKCTQNPWHKGMPVAVSVGKGMAVHTSVWLMERINMGSLSKSIEFSKSPSCAEHDMWWQGGVAELLIDFTACDSCNCLPATGTHPLPVLVIALSCGKQIQAACSAPGEKVSFTTGHNSHLSCFQAN